MARTMSDGGHARTRSISPEGSPNFLRHLVSARPCATVVLVIHAEEMQHAVQHQDADLVST